MTISREEILHVTKLAKIELPEKTIEKFSGQIENILEYVNTLEKLDTKNIEPTYNASFGTNALREDIVKEHLGSKKALSNAPEKEDGYFIVPKIIE